VKVGLQISSFTWPGGDARLGETLAAIVRTADDAGFDSIWVMDHFLQIGSVGRPEEPMLEGMTALGFMAAHSRRARLGLMVGGIHYRQAGLWLKAATTLDVLSGGRAWFGIGAAWNEQESAALVKGAVIEPLIEFAELIREGRDTFRTISREMIELKGDVSTVLGTVNETAETANRVIDDVGKDVGRMTTASAATMEDVQATVADARRIVHDVGQGQGTVGQLLTDRALYDRLSSIAREVEQTATNVRQTTDQARAAVEDFTSAGGSGPRIAQTLRTTVEDARDPPSAPPQKAADDLETELAAAKAGRERALTLADAAAAEAAELRREVALANQRISELTAALAQAQAGQPPILDRIASLAAEAARAAAAAEPAPEPADCPAD